MATKKKMLQAAAGQASGGAGGAALDITDVFSTYLYEGKGGAQVIQNGIKLGDLKEADDGVYYLSSPSSVIGNNSAGNTVTATLDGNVTLDSGTTKFASNSYNFDGASNIRLSRALIDTSSSFCFETWVYFDSTGVSNDMAMLLAQYKSGENGRILFGAQSGNLVVRYNGSTVALTAPVSASQWHHVAWSYDGTTHRLFVDGTLEDSTTTDFPIYTGVTTQLGGTDSTLLSDYDLDGRMEDIRITTGDARYTSSFTPPTASLPVTTAATVLEAGEGGLVWFKNREIGTYPHAIFDTERGATKYLRTNQTNAEGVSSGITAFNIDGFDIAGSFTTGNATPYVSWTFRKAPKFFDVVTYTGTGSSQSISHNLDCQPGMIIAKRTDSSTQGDWIVSVLDTSVGSTYYRRLYLNKTNASLTNDSATATTTTFDPNKLIGADGSYTANQSSATYVAYLFAHNDGDGEFGPDGDQDIIKCGSYTGNGSTTGPEIDLGFEPQWVMIKASSSIGNWHMFDTMRGIPTGGNDPWLNADESSAENPNSPALDVTATGFKLADNSAGWNGSSITYIYMAIRRGPLAQPESATDVFEVFETTNTGTASTIGSMGPSDFILNKRTDAAATWRALDRLRGGSMLRTDSTDTETSSGFLEWDKMGGVFVTAAGAPYITNDAQAHWLWKRAPGFFDVQAFTLGSASNREVKHNLAAVPEMIWWKERSDTSYWMFWHKDFTSSQYMSLHLSDAIATSANIWGTSAPTSTGWYMKETAFGGSGNTCISYTFASLPGISKVGSFSHATGTPTNVDCGFANGARFVLWKKYSNTDGWQVYDTTRGIVSGNDPFLQLNSAAAEITNEDLIDPLSSGFTVSANKNSGDYIFYAIA